MVIWGVPKTLRNQLPKANPGEVVVCNSTAALTFIRKHGVLPGTIIAQRDPNLMSLLREVINTMRYYPANLRPSTGKKPISLHLLAPDAPGTTTESTYQEKLAEVNALIKNPKKPLLRKIL